MGNIPPKSLVNPGSDTDDHELKHVRSVGKDQEQYVITWSTGIHFLNLASDSEFNELVTRKKLKKATKVAKPGKERYQRLVNEPIRV